MGRRGHARVPRDPPLVLRFLEKRGSRATFFVVAAVADVSSHILCPTAERNEVGSHGLTHRRLDRLTVEETQRELELSKKRLEEVGQEVTGFRAPFFRCSRLQLRQVAQAGYTYDASLGSVVPGPHNGYLSSLECPHRRSGLWEFPADAMCQGMMPLSLTYLRLTYPVGPRMLPHAPRLLYLHLHEFLPPETGNVLPRLLRKGLTRNCGCMAWEILARAFDVWDVQFTCCRELLAETGE